MNWFTTFACSVVIGLSSFQGASPAQQPPSFAKKVKPFLAKYCVECHNASQAKGELVLDTFKAMQEGGKSGPVVTPGKPDESRLVLLAEKKQKPAMPPKDSKQPKPEEVAVLRAWVASGAKDDSATVAVTIPKIMPRVKTAAPVSALAYRADGKVLAVGGHGGVLLLDVVTGEQVNRLPGHTGRVTALAFSRQGGILAAASGSGGTRGEVRIYRPSNADHVLLAHGDLIYDLRFSPDDTVLATTGYDRLIKLWDVRTGHELRVLKDHSDAVYGLAFSPDGKHLASASADRAVKVWDVATGKRLYTLGESTDWVYSVAWHPNGKQVAAAGVDKSIRVWEVSPSGGKIVHSVFAHEGPVTRLAYSADGTTLYSLSEDRTVKAWDAAKLVERKVYPKQAEAILSLAVRPDHKQLALGRYDGSLTLVDEASGKVQMEPLPAKPKPPQISKLYPMSGPRGRSIRLSFEGKYVGLGKVFGGVVSTVPGLTSAPVFRGGMPPPNTVEYDVTFPAQTPAGVYQLRLTNLIGESNPLPFTVDPFESVGETEPNDSPSTGQPVKLPVTLVGVLQRAGDVDWFRFEAQAGQQLGIQAVTAAVGSKLEPILSLKDATGQVLAESTTGVLGFTFDKVGTYALGIRDRDYRGGAEMHYRLHAGDLPVITSVFPLGLQRGTERVVLLDGVNLPTTTVTAKADANAANGSRVTVSSLSLKGAPLGIPSLVVGEFPEVIRDPRNSATSRVAIPGTANGVLHGAADVWRFPANKGQPLILEVNARRLGSPLDSMLEVLDANGQAVPRATLRCQAKTYVTFRDHDSANPNIRIEAWSELAINDHLWVGNELLRIKSLPTHPDADCIFFSDRGQRVGYLDTTPNHQPMGQPMYKVTLHPPGMAFPPNGFPVITVPYRNDDGGPGYGKDSRLFFDPPADGEYQVRITDARGHGGSAYAYRMTVRPPRPSFNITFNPTAPAVWKGGALPIAVTAERIDGYSGEIAVKVENLPPGLHAPATTIPAGENTTSFALFADAQATLPAKTTPLKLIATAAIGNEKVTREVTGGAPKLVDPGDIVTNTDQSEVSLRPGEITRLTVTVERRNDFKGRIPLELRGLPHGVRVLDIGLNGILITERETTRTMRIYAEPWVEATEHPIVVLARREGKNTEHAARSVLLKVVK